MIEKKKQIVRLKREKYNIWHPTFNTNYNRYYICIYTYMNSICIYNEEGFCIYFLTLITYMNVCMINCKCII